MNCKTCGGICCTTFGIWINQEELDRIYPYSCDLNLWMDELPIYEEGYILSKPGEPCMFVSDGLCLIHEVKPHVCSEFECDPERHEKILREYKAGLPDGELINAEH